MLQNEFEERVGMRVSAYEYAAINTVYMESEYGKDEFCSAWVKMNRQRVEEYKKEQAEKIREELIKDRLYRIYCTLSKMDCLGWSYLNAMSVISEEQSNVLKEAGIGPEGYMASEIKHVLARRIGIY